MPVNRERTRQPRLHGSSCAGNHWIRSAGVAALAVLAVVPPGWAAARTFVSGAGNDANPCSLTAPCRTFVAALGATDTGGEIVVLESAGYGPVAINKPVSIVAPPGVYAGITATVGTAVSVNAGSNAVVVLRGLVLNGLGGTQGIVFNSGQGSALHLENLVISGFTQAGVTTPGGGALFVKDTISRGNGIGISITGGATASMERVRVERNNFGVAVNDGTAVVRNCVASGNTTTGLFANPFSASPASLHLDNCLVANNGVGLRALNNFGGTATARIANSLVAGNTTGLQESNGGTVES